MKIILGISAYYHDSAATLLLGGVVVAAAQEERFTRVKNTAVFPEQAIRYCLAEAGLDLDDVDAVVFYDKPFLKFERLLENYYRTVPKGLGSFLKFLPEWSQKKIFLKKEIKTALIEAFPNTRKPIHMLFSSHHLSHAASAFYPSPFQEAAILTIDAVGEWATASIGVGKGTEIQLMREMHFPNSVGILYSSFTYFLGFKVNEGEYKLMGLSPYSSRDSNKTKLLVEKIKTNLVSIFEDGSIVLNQRFFKYRHALKMINTPRWERLFGLERRKPGEPLTKDHADLALAIQLVTEEIVLKMAKTARDISGSDHLCLAGGVALNCVANGLLQDSGIFKQVWVQPAAGDAGGAFGAALAAYYAHNPEGEMVKNGDLMQEALLGPAITEADIQRFCTRNNLSPQYFERDEALYDFVAEQLADNQVVGWVRGRMEFGPRALGSRSILASPFPADMQRKLNLAVKFREDFRPFAPVMLKAEAEQYFGMKQSSKYMQFVKRLLPEFRLNLPENFDYLSLEDQLKTPRSKFQAVTHVDFSSRIQIIDNEEIGLFHLLNKFKQITGDGVLVNTSFNTNGQPLVCSIEDAYAAFLQMDMSILVVENFVFQKAGNNHV